MPVSNIIFWFWVVFEIIMASLIVIYMYGRNMVNTFNQVFDNKLSTMEKLTNIIYTPILLLLRMICPMIDSNALFWGIQLPLAIGIVTIFEIIPTLYNNFDLYRMFNNILNFIVGNRRNNYNYTEQKNNYGNYIPVILLLIAIFVFINQMFGPVFALLSIFLISVFFYTTINIIYMFFMKNSENAVNTIKKYAINDYIFIIVFGMVWMLLILGLFMVSKDIMESFKRVV